ncbi:MAG TPA: iron-containing alcohol dehydrogenase [Bacteroidales bacterium]|nr:iron-containing alcohol dehydrogenase [Bacteroidales bacterium]HRS17962.1 iron-containing alcohol dehydrogenase [Bacteroidales bacterium]
MNNFEYYNPVNIVFGKQTIAKLSQLIPTNAKVMLLYGGGSIKHNGVYDQVIAALKGFSYIEFGGIEPNPRYETMMKALELAKKENVTFLLPVGGGSVIDGTKFLAAAMFVPEGIDPWGILQGTIKVTKALPIGAVLTLPATGTEMNGNSVVSRNSTNEKLAFGSQLVMPQFSILDPETCFSLPDKQIANGIVDAFIHVMEQYLTIPNNTPLQDRWAESILTTLIEVAPIVMKNKTNYDAMATFMWTATMALNGIISRGCIEDWSTHIIGHELTALYDIDHGRTLAIVLPGNMNIRRQVKGDKIIQYGQRVWNITQGSRDEKINKTIEKTVEFFESLGVPTTLKAYTIGADVCKTVSQRLASRGLTKFGEAGDITPEVVEAILKDRL